MEKLELLKGRTQERRLLENAIHDLYDGEREVKILEAGCGQRWGLNLKHIKYVLTGVDLDANALEIRKNTRKDLDEFYVGDLRYIELDEQQFDVVYSSFVLEHIENADLALRNLSSWLRAGGLLILRIPDRDTVYGFCTRKTPFWLHVLYKRYFLGDKNAGKPGYPPYPTYHDLVVSRKGIRRFCHNNNFVLKEEYGVNAYCRKSDLKSRLLRVCSASISAASLGRLPWHYNNLTYVLKKEQ